LLDRLVGGLQVQDRSATLDRVATETTGISGAHLRELVGTVVLQRPGSDWEDAPLTLGGL
jgi:hypothetical protein